MYAEVDSLINKDLPLIYTHFVPFMSAGIGAVHDVHLAPGPAIPDASANTPAYGDSGRGCLH
jgi:hypothetical protein